MAIAVNNGAAGSNSTAATSIAAAAFNAGAAQDILVAVAIAASGVTVTAITDTALNTYVLKSSATNSGNVRVELWQAQNIAANSSNVVTANVSGASLLAIAAQAYSGTANNTFSALDRTGWGASSNDAVFGAAANTIDGNIGTIWATNGTIPTWLILDMLTARTFTICKVLPRQDGWNDWPGSIDLSASSDGVTWGSPFYSTSGLPGNATEKVFTFSTQTTRYLRYQITVIASGSRIFQGAAEFNVGNTISVPSQITASATGSNIFPGERIAVQDNGGYHVAAVAFACSSGDTFAASSGSTIRRSVVPALTSVAVALIDVAQAGGVSSLAEARLSASRSWAVAGAELRPAATPASAVFIDYTGRLPVDGIIMGKEQRLFGTMPVFCSTSSGGGSGAASGNYGYTG